MRSNHSLIVKLSNAVSTLVSLKAVAVLLVLLLVAIMVSNLIRNTSEYCLSYIPRLPPGASYRCRSIQVGPNKPPELYGRH
jgi:hypothetical protein